MPRPTNEPTQVGAIITFPEGMTKDQVERLLHNALDHNRVNGYRVHVAEFNPNYGSPVWYIP